MAAPSIAPVSDSSQWQYRDDRKSTILKEFEQSIAAFNLPQNEYSLQFIQAIWIRAMSKAIREGNMVAINHILKFDHKLNDFDYKSGKDTYELRHAFSKLLHVALTCSPDATLFDCVKTIVKAGASINEPIKKAYYDWATPLAYAMNNLTSPCDGEVTMRNREISTRVVRWMIGQGAKYEVFPVSYYRADFEHCKTIIEDCKTAAKKHVIFLACMKSLRERDPAPLQALPALPAEIVSTISEFYYS